MPALPTSLSLTSILDGSAIIASDHRNNYSSIQTDVNALITALTGGAAGDVLGGVGTTLTFAKPPGYEFARSQITADVTVSGTSGAQTTVIGPTSGFTFDGATAVDIVFYTAGVITGTADQVVLELYEDAGSIGRIALVSTGSVGGEVIATPVFTMVRRTPSAASHTYTVKAYRGTANGTVQATASIVPCFLKVVKV